MTLSMARCVGRAGCDNDPTEGRGLCTACYHRHRNQGTLDNFPTMRERTRQLRDAGELRVLERQRLSRRRETQGFAAARRRREQYASRVLLDDVLVHPGNLHGRVGTYNTYGCRGAMCYAAHRHYRATGEATLPEALTKFFGPEDCVMYVSDVYPDRRKK